MSRSIRIDRKYAARLSMHHSLRMLIVTHAPLSPGFGAAQVALNLGDALRALGHDVTVWSPQPIQGRKWQGGLQIMRARLDEFIRTQPAFDVIEVPSSMFTSRLRGESFVLVRSVQPDLLYLAIGLTDGLRISLKDALRFAKRLAQSVFHGLYVLQGWGRADLIFCQGVLEYEWMKRVFSIWRPKFRRIVSTLSELDQNRLREVRERRAPYDRSRPMKLLWIGRWARHKGNFELMEFLSNWIANRPGYTVTIAGCGDVATSTFPPELLKSRKLEVVPSYTREELPLLLARHDTGLFTSKVEGWGLVLNEMLESGMRVFATETGGVPDLDSHFPGYLMRFPPTAEELETPPSLAPDWETYYGTFSWNSIARQYVADILAARPALTERI